MARPTQHNNIPQFLTPLALIGPVVDIETPLGITHLAPLQRLVDGLAPEGAPVFRLQVLSIGQFSQVRREFLALAARIAAKPENPFL